MRKTLLPLILLLTTLPASLGPVKTTKATT
jgi:hypothetical protein